MLADATEGGTNNEVLVNADELTSIGIISCPCFANTAQEHIKPIPYVETFAIARNREPGFANLGARILTMPRN